MGYYRRIRNQNKKVTILDYVVGIPFVIFLVIVVGVWHILESIYKLIKK